MANLLPFIIALFALAAFLRLDFLLYILYVFFGLYLLSRWWVRRAIGRLRFQRVLSDVPALLRSSVKQCHRAGIDPVLFPEHFRPVGPCASAHERIVTHTWNLPANPKQRLGTLAFSQVFV